MSEIVEGGERTLVADVSIEEEGGKLPAWHWRLLAPDLRDRLLRENGVWANGVNGTLTVNVNRPPLGSSTRDTWLVRHVITSTPKLRELMRAGAQRKRVPWAGVAARLPGRQDDVRGDGADVTSRRDDDVSMSAYCTLPLPVATGLPVAVNGAWELGSSRGDIQGVSEGTGTQRSEWNRYAFAALEAAFRQPSTSGQKLGELWSVRRPMSGIRH